MAMIKCRNEISVKGEKRSCDKFLAILPDCVMSTLRDNPGTAIILRCHDCPGETKWVDVLYEGQNGFTWRNHEGDIDFASEETMQFAQTERFSIGG